MQIKTVKLEPVEQKPKGKGWKGIKLNTANEILSCKNITIVENAEEEGYETRHPLNGSILRRKGITRLFIAILNEWFEFKGSVCDEQK